MQVARSVVAWLEDMFPRPRCKDGWGGGVEVEPGDRCPTVCHEDGFTVWKKGRPRKYHRVIYFIRVGRDWLIARLPISYATFLLRGDQYMELDYRDLLPALPLWWDGCESLDPEEDRLYAAD